MALPTSYDEDEVAAYMQEVIGETAHKMNLDADDGDFEEAVNEVLLLLDKADFSFVSSRASVKQVRTVARQEAWKVVMNNAVAEVAHSVGAPGTGQSSRQTIFQYAKDQYQLALAETKDLYPELYDEGGAVGVQNWTVSYTDDYYGNQAD